MRKRYLTSGFIFLLAAAYIDSIRGVLLPLLKDQFNLTFSQTSLILVGSYIAGITLNFWLNTIYNRFGETKTAIAVAVGSIFGILSGFVIDSYLLLIVFGLLTGGAIATLNSVCNILVMRGSTNSSRTKLLCGLHLMYGLGCLAAPIIVRHLLASGFSWQLAVSVWPVPILVISIFVLKKLPENLSTEINLSNNKLNTTQTLAVVILCTYAASEIICSMWMTTYLTQTYNYSLEQASSVLSGFFTVFIIARLASIIFATPTYEKLFLYLALCLGLISFELGLAGYIWAFAFTGTMSPFFPIFLSRISITHHLQIRSITVWTVTGIQISLCILNIIVGQLSDYFPIHYIYHLPLLLIILTLSLITLYFHEE